jgi:hypothetical protein
MNRNGFINNDRTYSINLQNQSPLRSLRNSASLRETKVLES